MSPRLTSPAARGSMLVVSLLLAGCAGGGSSSGSQTTTTSTPTTTASVPTVASVAPARVDAGSAALTLTVAGTNFTSSSSVQVGTVAEPTTYVSATQLTATVPAAQLASGALLPVVVLNGSGTSASGTVVNLEIDNPAPTVVSFSPTGFPVGSTAAQVSVGGTGFVPTTTVNVNGSARPTTYVSGTQVNVALSAADLAGAATLNLTAVNSTPGGGTSAGASLPVNNPLPTVSAVSPTAVVAGTATATPITVTGTNFVSGSTVVVNGSARSTTYVSATQLTSALTVADAATAASLKIAVVTPAPGGGTSSAATITVSTPTATPVLTSLSPSTLVVSSANTSLSIYGTGFNVNCKVLWNTTSLAYGLGYTSTYVNGTYVSTPYFIATVPSSLLSATGMASITASCPTALSPLSNALTVTISNPPAPTLTSISPGAGAIGTDVKVTLTGTNFTANSVVNYNGAPLTTTYGSATSLAATLPAAMNVLPGNGSFTVTVPAPGGGTSAAAVFTAYVPLPNKDMVFNPVNGLFYASVPSSAGAPYGNTVVSIDPATGAIGTPIPVGSEPNRLALTADGRYLWVGLDGANAVRKVDLVAGVAGLQFSIPQQTSNSVGGPQAYALAALPNATDSVLVSSANFPNYFGIYDSGVVRGSYISGYYTEPYAILADGSRSEVYASGGNGYQTFTYNSTGLTVRAGTTSNFSVPYAGDMQIASGRVYPSNGKVYDAESGALLGTLYVSGTTVASGTTWADASLGKVFVLDNPSTYYYSTTAQIQVFNATDFTGANAIPLNLTGGYYPSDAKRLTRWGSNGLAFRTPGGLYSVRSNLVKDLSGTSADLGVTLSSSGTSTGAPVTFTAQVTNSGTAAATNVVLGFVPPSNALQGSVTTTAGTCSAVTTVTCNLGSLASGATATVTLPLQPLQAGNVTLAVQVAGSENDPVASNNSATATAIVTGADYNPPPVVSAISPTVVRSGASDTTLTLTGSGFNSGSVVTLGSTTLVATLVSGSKMTAVVPSASLAQMGWAPVVVTNGAPGGGASAPQPLTVFSVVTAGLNNLVYEPFSRKIFASVGSGSSSLLGNSIAQLTPETGSFNTPATIGSQPTRIDISSNGKYLYAVLNGATSMARFNIALNKTDFLFTPPTPTNSYYSYSSSLGFLDVVVQPGSETTLAVNYGGGGVGLVDVNPATQQATLRGSSLATNNGIGYFHFLDANTLFIQDGALEKYPVPSSGISSSTAHTGTYMQPYGAFKLSGKYAYYDTGTLADISGTAPVQLGVFTAITTYSYNQKSVGDAGLGLTFFAGATYASNYGSPDGIIAYNQSTFLPASILPLGISAIEGTSNYNIADLVRWGQDGLAMLTSTGHVYLLRGPVVVPGLLKTGTAASLTASSATSAAHGADNTLLTLTGTNFQPGVAVNWNGSYRTTTIIDATHVTVAIPASDLATAGTATLTAVNPGASASAGLTFTIN